MSAPIPATLPGLLRRGTVVHWRDEETPYVVCWVGPWPDSDTTEEGAIVLAAPCSSPCIGVEDNITNFTLNMEDPTSRAHLAWWILAQPGMQERRPHHIVAGHFVADIRQATNACERGWPVSPAQLEILTTVARHLAGLETA